MTISYSNNLQLTIIGTGDQAGVWGETTNTNLGTLLEQSIAGYVTKTVADSNTDPSNILTMDNGTACTARNMCIELIGTLTAARTLYIPSNKKLYYIYNNTTGGYAVTIKITGQTNGISIPSQVKVILVSNGGATDPGIVPANNALIGSQTYLGSVATDTVNLKGQLNTNGSAGVSGQVLFSQGTNNPPTWGYPVVQLSGTGTVNYLSKFTATNTIGNSQLFDNGINVGIGTATPTAAKLHVVGGIAATGNVTAFYSDDRLKINNGNIQDALEKVLSLNGFHYVANDLAQSLGYEAVPDVGLSAQQVQAVLPEVVAHAAIDPEYLTLRYERIVPLLVEAIKEQNAIVEAQKDTIASYTAQIEALNKRLDKLEFDTPQVTGLPAGINPIELQTLFYRVEKIERITGIANIPQD